MMCCSYKLKLKTCGSRVMSRYIICDLSVISYKVYEWFLKLCWIFFRDANGILNNDVLLIFRLEESLQILNEYILYQEKKTGFCKKS